MKDATTLPTTETLLLALENVRQLRALAQEAAERVADARAAWEAEHAHLLQLAQSTKQDAADAEARLRELAIVRYETTGDKRPAPGVGIRVQRQLDYDVDAALAWAKAHDLALTLDRKAFERLAKAQPVPCVTSRDEPQATLARDL